ncbi:MAG TPA: hypothetical protein VFP32_00995 [Candidatus Saccharimonadales bacterium]|nr:hypothetical protein [Candidatus Saccharimonadales bacterium]
MANETPPNGQALPPAEAPAQPIAQNQVPAESPLPKKAGRWARFTSWYTGRKRWTIPLTVLLVILILAGVPWTRYHAAGLVLKRDLKIKVVDSTTNTPVSGAMVSIGSNSVETDAAGQATLPQTKVGHHQVVLSKKYYKTNQTDVLTPILKQKTLPVIALSATGRQVKVSVRNLVNKNMLSGVNIKVAGITAKTDVTGSAVIVLPVGLAEQKGTLNKDGFNSADVTIKISNDGVQNNQFDLTPAGQVYFLSKLSGKIDVVKTNLDGTDRQTVLAGTGNEDDQGTVLLASRDWKYLALLSRRAGNSPSLYLLNTADDSLTTIDSGSASFNPVGWVNDTFIYTVTRNDTQLWQSGRQALKSFNAPSKKLIVLDQTTASGTNQYDYISELLGGVYAYDNQVYYIKNWTAGFNVSSSDIASKQATFNAVNADGSGKKAIKSFGLADSTQAIDVTLEEQVKSPSQTELKFSDGTKDNFYIFADGQVKADSNMTAENFYTTSYPTYLLSPSGNQTFWAEQRDGKNTLFIGDEEGENGKQIATLSEYNTYGWYTDDYLLVSKDASELYIMAKDGSQEPIKISDYHKPQQTFYGYGGGYGGL